MHHAPLRFALLAVLLVPFALGIALATVADGDRAFDRGEYEAAIAEYEAAVALRPSNTEAVWKLARAKTHLAETLAGDAAEALYEEAADHARAAILADPESAESHLELARALGRLAQFRGVLQSLGLASEVRSELERALELAPDLAGALHALALWHLEVPWVAGGRTSEVRPLFEAAIAAEPDGVLHYVAYGEALAQLGDEARAREQLQRALELPARSVREERAQAEATTLLATLP